MKTLAVIAGKPVKHPRGVMHALETHSVGRRVELKRDQVTLSAKVILPAARQIVRSFASLPADVRPVVF
jgi:hypothetical protein